MRLLLVFSALFLLSAEALARPLYFDGDRRSELAVFKGGVFHISSLTTAQNIVCGGAGDVPVPGNFVSGAQTELATWNPSTGLWTICDGARLKTLYWGAAGDRALAADFDGDAISDVTVWRPGTGEWFSSLSGGGSLHTVLGAPGDLPLAEDFDGDGRDDIAVFRRSGAAQAGSWYFLLSGSGRSERVFGLNSDIPVPADYNGDGRSEIAVFRDGLWLTESGEIRLGAAGDIPAPADFDGDGKADLVVYRPQRGAWLILGSRPNAAGARPNYELQSGPIGAAPAMGGTDRRSPLDFDGDRKTDLVVMRTLPSGVLRFLYPGFLSSGSSKTQSFDFGLRGDIIIPGDYDGDGLADLAAVRPSAAGDALWRIRLSASRNAVQERAWGMSSDVFLAADSDGDRKSDLMSVREEAGQKIWRIKASSGAITAPISFGTAGDTALAADTDGDERADLIAVRQEAGRLVWAVKSSVSGAIRKEEFGVPGDRPFADDYDGDGVAEFGVERQSEGKLVVFVKGLPPFVWGNTGDASGSGVYGPERALDRFSWRVEKGQGYFRLRAQGGGRVAFGVAGDKAVDPHGQTRSAPPRGLQCASEGLVSQQQRGFVWRPAGKGGRLTVLFPKTLRKRILLAALVTGDGTRVIETLQFSGNTADGRPAFRGRRPGSAYPAPVILIRKGPGGSVDCVRNEAPWAVAAK